MRQPDPHDPAVRPDVDSDSADATRLEALLDEFHRVRLLVLGDLVLDEYVWGDVERVSPEAPVPVVHVRDETVMLGGAANAARNVVALGGSVECCSVIGSDAAGRSYASQLAKVHGADISERDKRLILGGNIERVLGPIFKAKGIQI